MSVAERAKQFLPFAAVKGLPEALAKKEKVSIVKVEISEELAMELDEKMHRVQNGATVTVKYFDSGAYVRLTGIVVQIDPVFRTLQIEDTIIEMDDILDLNT
jgi:hypothetical protein